MFHRSLLDRRLRSEMELWCCFYQWYFIELFSILFSSFIGILYRTRTFASYYNLFSLRSSSCKNLWKALIKYCHYKVLAPWSCSPKLSSWSSSGKTSWLGLKCWGLTSLKGSNYWRWPLSLWRTRPSEYKSPSVARTCWALCWFEYRSCAA